MLTNCQQKHRIGDMLQDLLERLGFSKKEILVYLTLVQRGRLTASELAATTQLNRTTVYGILSSLINKNVVIEDLAAATSAYLPAPVSSLVELFEKEEAQVRKQKELATRAATEISRLASNQSFQFAKITFIDEPDIESHLSNRTTRWCESMMAGDEVWRGFQDSRMLQQFPGYFKKLYDQLLPKHVTQELISEDMPAELEFEKNNYSQRQIKIWQHGYDFTYSTWVIGNYVIMAQVKDRPFYLIEMKDPALAKNLRDLFGGIWKMLPAPQK